MDEDSKSNSFLLIQQMLVDIENDNSILKKTLDSTEVKTIELELKHENEIVKLKTDFRTRREEDAKKIKAKYKLSYDEEIRKLKTKVASDED